MGAAQAAAPTERCIRSWQWVREWEQHPELYEEVRRNALGGKELQARRRARRRMKRYQLPELDGLRWRCKASQALVEWVALTARWRFSGLMASHAMLAVVLGCSPSTVPRAIAELVRRDLLVVIRLYELHPEGFRDRGGRLRNKRQLANLYAPGAALLALLAGAGKTERAPVGETLVAIPLKQGSPNWRSLGSSLSEKNKTREGNRPKERARPRARIDPEKAPRGPMRVGSLVGATLRGLSDGGAASRNSRSATATSRRPTTAHAPPGTHATEQTVRTCLAALADLFAGRISADETVTRMKALGEAPPEVCPEGG